MFIEVLHLKFLDFIAIFWLVHLETQSYNLDAKPIKTKRSSNKISTVLDSH